MHWAYLSMGTGAGLVTRGASLSAPQSSVPRMCSCTLRRTLLSKLARQGRLPANIFPASVSHRTCVPSADPRICLYLRARKTTGPPRSSSAHPHGLQMVKSDSNTNVGAGGGKSKALATRGPAGRGAVAR